MSRRRPTPSTSTAWDHTQDGARSQAEAMVVQGASSPMWGSREGRGLEEPEPTRVVDLQREDGAARPARQPHPTCSALWRSTCGDLDGQRPSILDQLVAKVRSACPATPRRAGDWLVVNQWSP